MPEPGLDVLGQRPGNWKVLLSPKALKSIQSMGRSGNFGPVEKKLRDLASGSWSYCLAGTEKQRKRLRVPLATTQCKPQILILWQVDVAFDDTTQAESQLLKVWEIGTKTEISQPIDRIIILQKSYSTEHVTRCRLRPLNHGDKKSIPTLFTSCFDAAEPATKVEPLDIRTVDREVLEMANRFYTLTEPMLRSVLAHDLFGEFPFDLSGDETRIILHFDTSSLILGRSGTGKTTCLVFKLLAKYAAGSAVIQERLPRQLLLTRSDELAGKLKDYINRLMKTLAASSADEGEQQERQLPLPDAEDDKDQCDTIFELQDGSFPLVCTFDQFLELLENTIRNVDQEGFPTTDDDGDAQESERSDPLEDRYPRWHPSGKNDASRFVDFQSFKLDYWPKFPATLVAKLPVELAFAEILGVIKGSLSSRETLKPLSRNDYLQLSGRLAPAFTLETEKTRVYDIFEKYQVLKLHRRESDGVDRVVKAIRAVRENQRLKAYLGASFDEIYIDEVQDLRCLEIELLLSMVNDGRAFHFAGDTAQTISQDSHFRFQDIKALFYDHFATEALLTNQPGLARPRLFMLAKNYRSHQGTLDLASLVMEMLWDGFPETVDKLEPEVGQIYGPIPVFFLGCSAQMLASSDTGFADRPKQTLDFGAEQAIIVRDPDTKVQLQAELGDKALVLTILQSKGMEFEDVFLWNFFTDSPCPGGWRCLKTKPESFNAKRHAGMCSELKHFYVAITRARIRLSIIESDESLAAQVASILKQNASSSPLVEVTKSSDPDFLRELISLRSVSYDPGRWSDRGQELMQRKQHEDAIICFRRAKDERGETHATACIAEENGRRQASVGNTGLARSHFRTAADKFVELDLAVEAIRNLERMEEFEEAAELWSRKKKYGKAAPFYEKAGLFKHAADCYHVVSSYDKAADALRRGNLADQLVAYVAENQQHLSSNCFRRHSRFCVLLLKQEKLLPISFVLAIELLGTPDEQESAFISYGMREQLRNLYIEQRNVKKLFLLHFKAGELAEALKTLDSSADTDSDDFLVQVVQRAYDYFFAGAIVCGKDSDRDIFDIVRRPPSGPAEVVIQRIPEWITAHRVAARGRKSLMSEEFERMEDGLVKRFLELHFLLDCALVEDVEQLREVPFQTLQAALNMAKYLSSSAESCQNPIALLLTGVLKIEHKANHFVLLSWSPLRAAAPNVRTDEYPRVATQWLLERIASVILAFDTKSRDLWRLEWPVRCVNYLTFGSCRKLRDGMCPLLHKRLSAADCTKIASVLVKINTIFCSSSVLYFKGVMGERFQESFLGIRRHWLESLVQELTFISSVERCSQVIVRVQSDLLAGNPGQGAQQGPLTVASHIEGLLFHRLGREWNERNDLSSLFEQIQLSQIFGISLINLLPSLTNSLTPTDFRVQERFTRALLHRLYYTPNSRFQMHMIRGLRSLEGEIGKPNAASFSANLENFSAGFESTDVRHLTSFHALTTVFEFFALYLIFKTCRTGLVIPQSWIDIHLPWFVGNRQSLSTEALPHSSVHIYRRCLMDLMRDFARIISQLDPFASSDIRKGFRLGLRIYPSRLLHRRNVELLSVAIINLRATGVDLPNVTGTWTEVSKAFDIRFLGADHLQHRTIAELVEKLVKSYGIYEGKDAIKLIKTTAGYHYFEGMLQKLGVQTLSLESIHSTISRSRNPMQARSTVGAAEEYNESHIQAACKIQRFWRDVYPQVRQERNLMKTPQGRLVVQFRTICKQYSVSDDMRDLLTSKGFELHERHRIQSVAADKIQQRAVDLACTLSQDQFETVNEVVDRLHDIKHVLDNLTADISVDRLQEMIQEELTNVQTIFRMVDDVLQKVESDLREVTQLLKTIK
ncbi:MAG: hypothetical protein Q9181_004094 [Wetmoreana brouardii]